MCARAREGGADIGPWLAEGSGATALAGLWDEGLGDLGLGCCWIWQHRIPYEDAAIFSACRVRTCWGGVKTHVASYFPFGALMS